MAASARLRRVIDANAKLWAGEAEVFRTYWTWPGRTRATDRQWLFYQCYKEIWGSGVGDQKLGLYLGPLAKLEELFPKCDVSVDRHEILDIAEGFWAEFAHYCAFADAYDGMAAPGEPKMNPAMLHSWAADDELGALRYKHRNEHGKLGLRACSFTEGGYCTLFAEGMALARDPGGHDGRDGLIAEACRKVYDDEFGHMLKGVMGLDRQNLSDAEWDLFERLTVEQLKLRIRMRNAQFGNPLPEARIQAIYRGEIAPLAFDYRAAEYALAA